MPEPPPPELAIDIVSDVVCPWCFIGKRRLAAALASLAEREPALRPVVAWHPFQLNPGLPAEGMDRRAYLDAKFGGAARAGEIYGRLRAAGASVGIDFAFERIARQPNTLAAHRLIAWAEAQGRGEALVERLFCAYFLDGRDIGERAVLAALAGEAGLDPVAARAHLASVDGIDALAAADRRARQLGIDGVPFFIFNRRVGVSGAQEPATLLAAIAESRAGERGAPRASAARIDPA
jgi:predicted DsbA family dithiol-disulfide isomerase